MDLYNDLLSAYDNDSEIEPKILQRLSEKLQLTTISDLTQESLALHEMVVNSGGDPGEKIEKISTLLKKVKDFVQTRDPQMGATLTIKGTASDGKLKSPIIPDDFRCPISLELMKDPVIVATGQVGSKLLALSPCAKISLIFPLLFCLADVWEDVHREMVWSWTQYVPEDAADSRQHVVDSELCAPKLDQSMVRVKWHWPAEASGQRSNQRTFLQCSPRHRLSSVQADFPEAGRSESGCWRAQIIGKTECR